MSDPKHISILVAELQDRLTRPPERHPVIRTGERKPIPWVVRLSVARRDGFNCRSCGWNMPDLAGMELDHILPWSAGGGDHSSNLRVLCSRCNQQRSNFNDGAHEGHKVPTTWWCETCWLDPEVEANQPDDFLDTHGVYQRQPRPVWSDGTYLENVRWVGSDRRTLAYCAWCWGYGYTDLAFTPELQRDLAAMTTTRSAA